MVSNNVEISLNRQNQLKSKQLLELRSIILGNRNVKNIVIEILSTSGTLIIEWNLLILKLIFL